MTLAQDAAEYAAKVRADPVAFVSTVFGETCVGKQGEILEALRDNRAVYVRSCHDSGKTWLAAHAVLWWLLAHPSDAVVVSTAPSFSQVEQLLWREIAAAYGRAKVPLGGRLLTTRLDLGPRWFGIGLATDQPVNLMGFHSTNLLLVVDEADGVPASIWTALDGILTTANSKTLAVGNPLSSGSEFHRRHDAALTQRDAKCIKIAASDVLPLTDRGRHPYLLQRSWVDEKRERWGEGSALYQGKVLAEWPDQGTDVLIPLAWLERARGRAVRKGLRSYGVDVARFGSARTVRTLLAGNWLEFSRATVKEDTMQTAGRVLVDIQQYAPVASGVDDVGVGGGVVDRLRQLGTYVTPLNFGGRAFDNDRFANRGSEIYWLTRDAFEQDLIGFDMSDPDAIDELIVNLNQPTYDTDERGRIRVNKFGRGARLSEEETVARSPDRGDSFVIAYSVGRPSLTPEPERPDTRGQFERPMGEHIELEMRRMNGEWSEGDEWAWWEGDESRW